MQKELKEITDAIVGDFEMVGGKSAVDRGLVELMVYEMLMEMKKAIRAMPYREFREYRKLTQRGAA